MRLFSIRRSLSTAHSMLQPALPAPAMVATLPLTSVYHKFHVSQELSAWICY
jgi:hypothetical protein